jgi:hypothetical protein
MIRDTFGEVIAEARVKAGFTQREMAVFMFFLPRCLSRCGPILAELHADDT